MEMETEAENLSAATSLKGPSGATFLLLGDSSSVEVTSENLLLAQDEEKDAVSKSPPFAGRLYDLCGQHVSVINMVGLQNTNILGEGSLQQAHIGQTIHEQGIHAFVLLLPYGQHVTFYKAGMKWLENQFGKGSNSFTMIVVTHGKDENSDSALTDLRTISDFDEQRYHACTKTMTDETEITSLLEKINAMISKNEPHCYKVEKTEQKQHMLDFKSQEDDKTDDPVLLQTARRDSTDEDSCQTKDMEGHDKLELPKGRRRAEEESTENPGLKKEIEKLMERLDLKDRYKNKLSVEDFLVIEQMVMKKQNICSEKELCRAFMRKLISLDYKSRYTQVNEKAFTEDEALECSFDAFCTLTESTKEKQSHIHPMDLQMAMFHCADSFLQQYMMTKLSQCQYALPVLVPSLSTKELECPLWAFRKIRKSWKNTNGENRAISMPICQAQTPMVAVFRLGSPSESKSQLLCNLINENHKTFFHRHCSGSTKSRLLMDGVVDIAWYCPSGKSSDDFTECIAFCNLHGDGVENERQRDILTQMASVNIVLVSSLSEKNKCTEILKKLFNSHKPLICITTDDESVARKMGSAEKYKIGTKDRNQSEVSKELKSLIRNCLSGTKKMCSFNLENMAKQPGLKVDEEFGDCRKAKTAAESVIDHLSSDLLTVKDTVLPCQGSLWHDWCKQNKELYKLQDNIENEKSKIHKEMGKIRRQQYDAAPTVFMQLFLAKFQALKEKERMFFLTWVEIFLDQLLLDPLSTLQQKYHEKWNEVLKLKRNRDQSDNLEKNQKELEDISTNLQAVTFGLQHILREMGQIYEASAYCSKTLGQTSYYTSLPKLAAEVMISGHPIELMDGDAAHVPLTWITSVLDEVIKELKDPKIFVLSVLGLQSTGKSTLLNTMFGLELPVSAGRCTRGAFMQLLRVPDANRAELKVDYVLVIDTEGLRALDLHVSGTGTFNHDNELATFVIGVGHMTLINILGETSSEIQDIVQIAVQAFMRMKMVNLSPSCVFVHQNVGDLVAGEKNMEYRRRLQERLDEMTQLAAKEEGFKAECFNDIIAFDIQSDVSYIAQLWEGSPPMAPPNPSYSENIMEVKNKIISKISKSGGKCLSAFVSILGDLWTALLNENFVFSFKNTLEVSLHRKLEEECGKWSWDLRSAFLKTENMLRNNIENGKISKVDKSDILSEIDEKYQQVLKTMNKHFAESKHIEIVTQWKSKFESNILGLLNDLVRTTRRKMFQVIEQKEALQKLQESRRTYEDTLVQKSKDLALKLQDRAKNENKLKSEFDSLWETWVSEVSKNTPLTEDINIEKEVTNVTEMICDRAMVDETKSSGKYKSICIRPHYNKYLPEMNLTDSIPTTFHHQIRTFVKSVNQQAESIVESLSIPKTGYSSSHMHKIANFVKEQVQTFQSNTNCRFKKKFSIDLSLYVCENAGNKFTELHKEFLNNNASTHIQKLKPQYYSVFKQFVGNSTSTAVLGDFLCSKLKSSIEQAVYDQAAIALVGEIKESSPELNGNKSNVEKHILKLLANKESFNGFKSYIENPKEHFEKFITDNVERYLKTEKHLKVIKLMRTNIDDNEQCILHAMESATREVKQSKKDIHAWLKTFCDKLSGHLVLSGNYPKGVVCPDITDFDFLEKTVKTFLEKIITEFKQNLNCLKMEMFRESPDETLKKHLCNGCWEQCPFCYAVCTNDLEGHETDHNTRFHRTSAIPGIALKGSWLSYRIHDLGLHRLAYCFLNTYGVDFCTTLVASGKEFLSSKSNKMITYKEYKKAGPPWECWSITPHSSEAIYWKWFMCRFEKNLKEIHPGKTFGKIPDEWRKYTKKQAIESLL